MTHDALPIPNRPLRELHLFAGCGGGILGGILLGHTCVCAVEIEPYRRKVLLQRQRDGILPKFPIWDNVLTFDGKPWRGKVDVVCAGIPCQKVSCAGTGEGFIDQDYYASTLRIIRDTEPDSLFLENSSMLVSRGLGEVLWDLAEMGYDAKWGVFSAADVGARHERERMWIAASNSHQERLEGSQRRATNGLFKVDNLVASQLFPQNKDDLPEPRLLGSGHGIANRVERTKAIGDMQVPAVVALAWETLT